MKTPTRNPERLREWRACAGYTFTDLSERTGIDRRQLARYEAGIGRPSVGAAVLLAEATSGAVPVMGWLSDAERARL